MNTTTNTADTPVQLSSTGSTSDRATGIERLVDPSQLDTTHGPILYLDDITVSFDGFKALNKLTLTIDRGELRCVIGPNGAGKTTMMDVITGTTRSNTGTAYFGQTIDLSRLNEAQIAHTGIGRKFQKPTVFEQLTVFENLELAMKTDKSVFASLRAKLSGEQRDKIEAKLIRFAVTRPEAMAGDRHAAHAGAAVAVA
jgi:urea transport system ATP-binding protein